MEKSPSIRLSSRGRTGERGYVLVSAIAGTLAESGAELAAADIVNQSTANITAEDDQGKMTATLNKSGSDFTIVSNAETSGVAPQKATVRVQGRVEGTTVTIQYTFHSQ